MFSTLLLSASAYQSVDVSEKFYAFASSYCGSDNLVNADIGNGNLINQFKSKERELGAEHFQAKRSGAEFAKMSKEDLIELGFRPGAGNEEELALGDCSEAHGNTCQNNGGLYHWCNYSQYKCMSKYAGQNGAVTYSNMNKSPAVPEIYTLYYDNDYPQNTSSTITKTLSTESEQTISTTLAFHIGASLEISAGEPGIMSAQDTFSWSFDMSHTSTDTKTTKDSFSWEGTIPEDEMSTTMVEFTVTKESYSGEWSAQINLPYYAKLWCNKKVNDHWEWFLPAQYFMGSDPPYEGKGVFTGGAGVSLHTTVRKCKLFASTVQDCDEKSAMELKTTHLAPPKRFN